MTTPQICTERLCLTADKQALVRAGHEEANSLFATPGTEIPGPSVERFGLVDGTIPEDVEIAHSKDAGPAETKPADPPEDKTITLGQGKATDADKPKAPELIDVPGIGEPTAKKLVAAGIAGVAGLAGLDSDKAPTVEGLPPSFKWAKVIDGAKALLEKDGAA